MHGRTVRPAWHTIILSPRWFDKKQKLHSRRGIANKGKIMAEQEKAIEDRVRERAYALWEEDGRPDGRSDEYWQQARSEVEAEEAEPGKESA
ncbi:MAG: DUF2934 domain-containing protein [Acetobacteraceae bacterium]